MRALFDQADFRAWSSCHEARFQGHLKVLLHVHAVNETSMKLPMDEHLPMQTTLLKRRCFVDLSIATSAPSLDFLTPMSAKANSHHVIIKEVSSGWGLIIEIP